MVARRSGEVVGVVIPYGPDYTTALDFATWLIKRLRDRGMQVDVAYALWSALGTTAIVLIAVLFLGSPMSITKVVGIALVIGGVITLNLAGAH